MRRTKAESDATAQALLDEATRQFAELGYAAVSLEGVATAVGVTRGAIAHHFGTKGQLFTQVVGRIHEAVGERVAAAADAVADPWEAFEVGCWTFLEQSHAPSVRRILLIDAPAVLGWATWRERDAMTSGRHLGEALTGLVEAGLIDVASVPAMTALLSGAMNEVALWAASGADDGALEQAWHELRRLLAALRAAP